MAYYVEYHCFHTQKELTTLHSIGVLLKGISIELHANNFAHVKILCMHLTCTLVTMHRVYRELVLVWHFCNENYKST